MGNSIDPNRFNLTSVKQVVDAPPACPLASGGALSCENLVDAYRCGVFPWYSAGEPVQWWSPDPRLVLFPARFSVSRSLRKSLRNKFSRVRFDGDFVRVIELCSKVNDRKRNTWITDDMKLVYTNLFRAGYAHCVEIFDNDDSLAAGLYGIGIGRMFFGESMFSLQSDGSKSALFFLAQHFIEKSLPLIDCQTYSHHLASLGAQLVYRKEFLQACDLLCSQATPHGLWHNHNSVGVDDSRSGGRSCNPT